HEQIFSRLVEHCLEYARDETIAAIAARAADLQVVGADIDSYQDKVKNVADAGIFGAADLRQAISDRITAWGLAGEPALKPFVIGHATLSAAAAISARLRGGRAATRVASFPMASDMFCCQGGPSRHQKGRAGPGPGAAAPAELPVRVRAGLPARG